MSNEYLRQQLDSIYDNLKDSNNAILLVIIQNIEDGRMHVLSDSQMSSEDMEEIIRKAHYATKNSN